MTNYSFVLSGGDLVTLRENGSPIHLLHLTEEATAVHFTDDGSQHQEVTCFEPTADFWPELVLMNENTSKMNEHARTIEDRFEMASPDRESWNIPYNRTLPMYEARIAVSIGVRLFHRRQDTRQVFEEEPVLRRLFRRAYVIADGEVPYYLR